MPKENAVDAYIHKQPSPQKEICQTLCNIILSTLPDIQEELKWGVPVYGGGKYYIGSLKDHVNLGFAIQGLTSQQLALFEGSGKTMRHIKVWSVESIDHDHIVTLLRLI